MTRATGWYWVKRMPEEPWQPAHWGPCTAYVGEWRWRMATYLEIHRGRMHRVGKRIQEPRN